MGNIDIFYTLCGDWGKEELKEKIGDRIKDPAKVIIFFKYLKLSFSFSLTGFKSSSVETLTCGIR